MTDSSTPQLEAAPVAEAKRPSPWVILGIVVMLVLVVLSTSAGKQWVHSMRYEGAQAPEVALPMAKAPGAATAPEMPVELSQYRGKVMLLDFWATWCRPCRKQLPVVNQLAHDPSLADDLQVVTINVDEHAPDRVANVEAYLKMKNYRVTTLLDDGSAQQAYRIQSIPTMVVVDRHGEVFELLYGVHDARRLREVIAEAAKL